MKKYLVALLLLTGCGAIPTTGPVNAGLDIGEIESQTTESAIPQAPRSGMTQVEVVTGFLAANASAIGDYSIAREYLAEFVAAEWLPAAGVQVFETALNLQQTAETTVTAVGIPKLRLDAALRPTLASGADNQSISFFLIRDNGEWRITNPPPGIILPSTEFQRNYEIANLWFIDKQQAKLVPDFIAISQRIDAATQLVRALSNGSSSWLKPAVINLLDRENSGGLASVQRLDGRIIVDLEATVLRLSFRQQSLLLSQIAQTLQPITDLNSVELTVGGQLIDIPGVANPVDLMNGQWLAQRSDKATNLYAIAVSGELVQPASSLEVNSWLDRFPAATNLTIAPDEQRIAVSLPSTGEIAVGYRTQNPRVIAQVAALSDLNFDANGTLWFVNRTSRTLFGYDGTKLLPADISIPTGGNLNHAMVSPDNIRVAVLSQSGATATLSIARLVKSDQSIALRDRFRILALTGTVDSISWFDATQLAMLVSFPNQADPVAVIVDIATAAQTIVRLPSNVVQLDANSFGSLVAVDRQQRIWQRTSGAWEQIGAGRFASYPRQ